MGIRYKLVLAIGIFLIGLPLIGECSWKSEACVSDQTCQNASKRYTVPYCVSNEVDYASICNFSSLTNTLSNALKSSDSNTKDMVSQYCKALLGDQNQGRIYYSKQSATTDNWDWSQTFDSHQSLFVQLLCSSLVNESGPLSFSGVFQGDVVKILKLRQMSRGKNKCSWKDSPTLDDCDMSLYATEIFSAIMSEIFKIKYAQIFHINSVDFFENKKEQRIQTFLSGYFKMTDEEFIKKFPETADVIDSNQQHYKTVLKNLKLIDNSALAKKAQESKCVGDMVGGDFIACALHDSQGNGMSLSPAFKTLFYNELMSYRIFVSYYWNWAQTKFSNDKVNEDFRNDLQAKAIDFQGYANLQIEAAEKTLRNFEGLNMTYPLHIGLLLYQEKVKEFRNKTLPPIVKIFYSLSEKLKNVQLPN